MPVWALHVLVVGPEPDVERVRERQEAQFRELREAGRLRAAGAYRDGDGWLLLLDVADRLEAESIAREAPVIADGLATWMLREWVELA